MLYEHTEKIRSFDGTEIFLRIFSPQKENFAVSNLSGAVLGVHGFCEHSGRYQQVAQAFCDKNLAFAAFDVRGHGKSGPSRGYAQNLSSLVLDVIFVLNYLKSLFPKKEGFSYGLLGHSFGGLLATYASSQLQDPTIPLFLSSPCYAVKQHIPPLKKFMVLQLANFIPKLSLPVGIEYENISNNVENNRLYEKDPLRLSHASARFGEIFFDALNVENVKHAIQSIASSVTLVVAKEDRLVDAQTTSSLVPLFKHMSNYVEIQGSGHEIFNEVDVFQKQAFFHLNNWIGVIHDQNRKSQQGLRPQNSFSKRDLSLSGR